MIPESTFEMRHFGSGLQVVLTRQFAGFTTRSLHKTVMFQN